jgi:hypothetical protein
MTPKKKTKPEKCTPKQIIDALTEASGIQAAAARKLGIARSTIGLYMERYPEVKAAYEDVNETTIDFVESKLMENIRKGNIVAQIFYLKTKAKHRGYMERAEVQGIGKDGVIKVSITDD